MSDSATRLANVVFLYRIDTWGVGISRSQKQLRPISLRKGLNSPFRATLYWFSPFRFQSQWKYWLKWSHQQCLKEKPEDQFSCWYFIHTEAYTHTTIVFLLAPLTPSLQINILRDQTSVSAFANRIVKMTGKSRTWEAEELVSFDCAKAFS